MDGGTKVNSSNVPCPYMVKSLQKSFPKPAGQWPSNLIYSTSDWQTLLYSNTDPELTFSTFHVKLLWVVRIKVCSNNPGHMTKMATIPLCGKIPLKIFSETSRPMTFELGILIGSYKVCSNDNPGLTLTYFMARSNVLLWVLLYGKMRKY